MKNKKTTRRSPQRARPAAPSKNKATKRVYRTRNWKEYNQALVQRGDVTLWIDQAVLDAWLNRERTGQRGASNTYSDLAIETGLTLRAVFHLPLRATQGMLASLLRLLPGTTGADATGADATGAPVRAPDYSTLSRRAKTLDVALSRPVSGEPVHLVVDSTGCKIYGEGEWKVRQHGWAKRRTWRKLHLGVDEATGEVLAATLSTNNVGDGEVLPDLLDQVCEPIGQVSGDGGYDQRDCYEAVRQRQEEQAYPIGTSIPPRRGARIWQHGNTKGERLARDENVRRIREVGRKRWKEESGYHRRSLAETTMMRLKSRFGDKLQSRTLATQATEAFVRCKALNRMTRLGMPDSYAV